MMARFQLYGTFLSGSSYKIVLMFSLLGEKFDYVHVNLRQDEHKRPDYLAKNRFGQVPCLIDTDNGLSLCQSGSILMYLADVTGRFDGTNLAERVRIREWIFWDFDRIVPNIFRPRGIRQGWRSDHEATIARYMTDGRLALGVLDGVGLDNRSWLVGDGPTIADIDLYGVVRYAPEAGYDINAYPNISAWITRFESLPGFGSPEQIVPKESKRAA